MAPRLCLLCGDPVVFRFGNLEPDHNLGKHEIGVLGGTSLREEQECCDEAIVLIDQMALRPLCSRLGKNLQ